MDAPAVAVTSDGKKVAAAWMDMRAGKNDRSVFWTLSNGGAFAPESSAAEDAKDIQSHPSLCVDADGDVHIVFEDMKSGKQIYHRTSAKGSKDVAITSNEGECAFPSIACGKTLGVAYESGGKIVFRAVPSPRR
jgi:hypothetical protein